MATQAKTLDDATIAGEHRAGFTLWELLYVVTITSIALGIGVPALRDIVLDAERRSAINGFVAAVRFARNEAQKRRQPLVLCPSADRRVCTGALDFSHGWIVLEPSADALSPKPLHAGGPGALRSVAANRVAFEFRPFPQRSTNGTIDFCDARGEARSRAVIVSYTGRPRVAGTAPGRCRGAR